MKTFLSSPWFLWPTLIVIIVALLDAFRRNDVPWIAILTITLCTCIDSIRSLPKRAKLSDEETRCADSGKSADAPLTDEQIEEIWNSLGYRTRFAPYMLRLVRAVQSHTAKAAKAEGELN